MHLVRAFAAERDREPQRVAGRLAQPGGEQRGGGRRLGDRGQRGLGLRRGGVVALGVALGVPLGIPLPQQRARLDEAQRQPLGLEPQVRGPARLVLVQGPSRGPLEQLESGRTAEPGEEDLLQVGVGGRRRDIGGGGDQERAFGGRVEELVQRGAAELDVVQDDDRADLLDRRHQLRAVRPVERGAEDGGVEVVEEVGGGAVVAGEAYDTIGREPLAVGGHGLQQGAAPGAGGPGDPHRAAAGEQPGEPLPLLVALQHRQFGHDGAGRAGRGGGAAQLGPLVGAVALGPGGPLTGWAGFYLAAVDGVDREQMVTGDDARGAGRGRGSGRGGGRGSGRGGGGQGGRGGGRAGQRGAQRGRRHVPCRPRRRYRPCRPRRAPRRAVARAVPRAVRRTRRTGSGTRRGLVVAVLLRSAVLRVHCPCPPDAWRAVRLPGLPSLLVRCRRRECVRRSPNPGPYQTAWTCSQYPPRRRWPTPPRVTHRPWGRRSPPLRHAAGTPPPVRLRSRGCGAAGWPPAAAASGAAPRAAPAVCPPGRPCGARP